MPLPILSLTHSPTSPAFALALAPAFCGAVNMHVWWAKQEEYSDELDDLEDAAAAAKEEAASGGADSADVATTAAAAAAAEGKPLTAEARLQKAQKEAEAVLNKEKKSR